MPLPTPHADESRDDFVARCMKDAATQDITGTTAEETQSQRVAACERQFTDGRKEAAGADESFGMKAARDVTISDEGKVQAVVACFDEVDNDGDVILSGAIPDGMKVTGSSYNHDTVYNRMNGIAAPDAPPVSKGVIRIDGKRAIAHIDYFMDTQRGAEAFKTVKAMGPDARWSFAYHYDEQPSRPTSGWAEKGARRMITKLGPLLDGSMEVSPVKMPGNSSTGTLSAKAAQPTASVDGAEHPAEDFAYVPDPEKPSTWKLPIFDKVHVQNALARLSQAQIPDADRADVERKIHDAAEKFGVEDSSLDAGKKSADDVTTELRLARTKRRIAGD